MLGGATMTYAAASAAATIDGASRRQALLAVRRCSATGARDVTGAAVAVMPVGRPRRRPPAGRGPAERRARASDRLRRTAPPPPTEGGGRRHPRTWGRSTDPARPRR